MKPCTFDNFWLTNPDWIDQINPKTLIPNNNFLNNLLIKYDPYNCMLKGSLFLFYLKPQPQKLFDLYILSSRK